MFYNQQDDFEVCGRAQSRTQIGAVIKRLRKAGPDITGSEGTY
jgi:hypothetical protein